MTTLSDSGATRCCKCQCHCCREPKWACSLCGRGFTRKFNVLRHLDTKHEGPGAPILYSEYRIGKSSGGMAEIAAHGDVSKSLSRSSPKSRRILALLNERTNETVDLVRSIRFANFANNIIISARVCKSCISLSFDGYIIMDNGNQTPLPTHLCRCQWLLDHPNIDSRSNLVERYLDEKIGLSLAEVIWPFPLSIGPICIQFSRLDYLERIKINYNVNEELIRQEKSEGGRDVLRILSEMYRKEEHATIDDIIRNHVPVDVRQYWWCSRLKGATGRVEVSQVDALIFLQFFKGNTAKIRLKSWDGESYYSVIIL